MNAERAGEVHIRMPIFDRFAGLRKDIQSVTRNAVEQTAKYLPLHDLTIRIKNNPKRVIPEHAHGGWTRSASEVKIRLDPHFPNQEQLLRVELPRAVSHELHHAVRNKALPDEPKSLGTTLIAEGLATIFETDVWGGEPSMWATALTKEQIQSFLEKIIKEWSDLQYNHAQWFFGAGELPRWAGYAIGVHLVKEYLQLYPNETAASLVATPASEIFDALASHRIFPIGINPIYDFLR